LTISGFEVEMFPGSAGFGDGSPDGCRLNAKQNAEVSRKTSVLMQLQNDGSCSLRSLKKGTSNFLGVIAVENEI
jgi:hypothetical protein